MEKNSSWWVHCITSNYISRWFKLTIGDMKQLQDEVESNVTAAAAVVETLAAEILAANSDSLVDGTPSDLSRLSAIKLLHKFQEETAVRTRERWWDFFWTITTKFRDLINIVDPHAENFLNAYDMNSIDRFWWEQVGFWGPPGNFLTKSI